MVTLEAGLLRLELNPEVGGSIRSFTLVDGGGTRPILRQAASDQSVLDAGSFPLVPYVNRIRGGRFTFRGREVVMRPNMAGDPSPLHGQGWLNPWSVADMGDAHAVLAFRHDAGEWPWSYDARQEIRLDEAGCSLRLECRNTSAEPMPCGLGQHPYFQCSTETRIDTRVTHVWTIDEQVLPVDRIQATGRFDLSDTPVCGIGLDHGFAGWEGVVRLSDPGWPYELRLSSPDAAFFQLYSPKAGGIFVAEPVSHANAALNAPEDAWPKLGMRVLEPSETMHLDMRLDVILKLRRSG